MLHSVESNNVLFSIYQLWNAYPSLKDILFLLCHILNAQKNLSNAHCDCPSHGWETQLHSFVCNHSKWTCQRIRCCASTAHNWSLRTCGADQWHLHSPQKSQIRLHIACWMSSAFFFSLRGLTSWAAQHWFHIQFTSHLYTQRYCYRRYWCYCNGSLFPSHFRFWF